ncbi:MAG: isoprenylcysteine carboxylmethyltransferase family protein [Chloroherpetonaceae bacterium]
MFARFLKQLRQIALLIAIALGVPAYFLEVGLSWQMLTLYAVYLLFLIGSVWNTIATGQVSQKVESKSVQKDLGVSTSLATAGLWLIHPLAIYDFAKQQSLATLLPETVSILAAGVLFLAAIVLVHHATRTLGKFFDRLVLKDDHQLITSGVYGAIRHPIYLAYLLLFSGFGVLMQSLYALILFAIAGGVVFGNHIRVEEAMMEKRFGKAYRDYCARTKKLIPFIY